MRVIPIIIGAIAFLAIILLWLLFQTFESSDDPVGSGGIDSGARIEIEVLRRQIEALQDQISALETEIQSLAATQGRNSNQNPIDKPFVQDGPNVILDAYAQVLQIPTRRKVNPNISVASPSFLEEFLGRPREVLSDKCEEMTNPELKKLLVLADVGPIQVNMLQPAVDSLIRVFTNIRSTDPDLYVRIDTAGSLCVRQIRGTKGRTSTHSFGLAVDLNIDGHLDTFGDGKTQLGLIILADFFREEGWVWGAGFSREDSMHFEISRQMLETWRAEGKI